MKDNWEYFEHGADINCALTSQKILTHLVIAGLIMRKSRCQQTA